MRKVTDQIVSAFLNGDTKTVGNTSTNGLQLFLHGNKIAEKRENQKGGLELWVSTCGWNTNTTRERLNALPGVHVQQKKGILYLNDKEWNGDFVPVNSFMFSFNT